MSKDTIKITKSDGFIWKIVTDQQAITIFKKDLFSLYALHSDNTESLINDLEELKEHLENNVEIGIEVGFTNYKEVKELKQLLKSHDFYYQRSDSHLVYKNGKSELKRISELSMHVNPVDFKKWWNRAAPQELQKA